MTRQARHRAPRPRLPVILAALVVALVVLGVYFHVESSHSGKSSSRLAAAQTTSAAAPSSIATSPLASPTSSAPRVDGVTQTPTAIRGQNAASAPVRLKIPAIGVDTGLQHLSLLSDGSLQSPSTWNEAGWYAGGVYPGQVGPAVIAGHIDSTTGPAVFYRLHDLRVGTAVSVTEQNGTVLSFIVDGLQTFPKNQFPAAAVYGPSPYPELRLVTCTGDFDWATHNYLSNLVVSAHLA